MSSMEPLGISVALSPGFPPCPGEKYLFFFVVVRGVPGNEASVLFFSLPSLPDCNGTNGSCTWQLSLGENSISIECTEMHKNQDKFYTVNSMLEDMLI